MSLRCRCCQDSNEILGNCAEILNSTCKYIFDVLSGSSPVQACEASCQSISPSQAQRGGADPLRSSRLLMAVLTTCCKKRRWDSGTGQK